MYSTHFFAMASLLSLLLVCLVSYATSCFATAPPWQRSIILLFWSFTRSLRIVIALTSSSFASSSTCTLPFSLISSTIIACLSAASIFIYLPVSCNFSLFPSCICLCLYSLHPAFHCLHGISIVVCIFNNLFLYEFRFNR